MVTGYDFVGDGFNASGSGGALIPHPDGDPDDCDGHGTHAPAVLLAGSFTRQAGGATYNVEDRNDRPVILFHLAHQSRRVEVRAVDVAIGESYDVAVTEFVICNPTNGVDGFFTFTWDGERLFTNSAGQTRRQELPNGVYKLELLVTKALAQEGNAAHIERWTSAEMVITRVP